MKIILPLTTRQIESGILTPIELFKRSDLTITIEDFSSSDKEIFFGVKNLRINGDDVKFELETDRLRLNDLPQKIGGEYRDIVLGNYKVVISSGIQNAAVWESKNRAELIFKTVLGCGFPVSLNIAPGTMFDNSLSQSHKPAISRRSIQVVNKEILERVLKLCQVLFPPEKEMPDKGETLKFFLDTAMSQVPNTAISGAFYVTLLESIFASEKDTEIRYRFSMRLAKIKREGRDYQGKIKKFYDKRSRVFHGSSTQLSKDELVFLESEACWAIEEYLKDPERFQPEKLDQLLLAS